MHQLAIGLDPPVELKARYNDPHGFAGVLR